MTRRPPSIRLTPNTYRVVRVAFTADEEAGRQPAEGFPVAPVRCSIHPTGAAVDPEHERQQGVEYLTVKLYQPPGVRVRDELIDDQGRTLVVVGVRGSSGGAGRSWLIDCEYRPEPGDG